MNAPHPADPAHKSWVDKLVNLFLQTPKDRKELRAMLTDAASRQLIDGESLHMIEGVMNVSQMQVRDVMMPRAQISFVTLGDSSEGLLEQILESGHSRFPVYEETKDDVVGILHTKDLLKHYANHGKNGTQAFTLAQDMLRKAMFVPESMRLDTLLKEFKGTRNHLAIVIDEYGTVSGMITLEDILEEIVGNIEDEFDIAHTDYVEKLSDTHYAVNALATIEEFNQSFNTHYDDEQVDTIGGFITHQLGYVPEQGEIIKVENLEFTVSHANQRHIESLIVRIIPNEELVLDSPAD
jgi:magnesium and cobalt transporter